MLNLFQHLSIDPETSSFRLAEVVLAYKPSL